MARAEGRGAKKCLDCGYLKPLSEFWRRAKSPDGFAPYCRRCFGLRNAASYRAGQARVGKKARPYRRHSDVPEGMKFCPNCKEIKPRSAFGSNRAKASGLAAYCRPCHNSVMARVKDRLYGGQRNFMLKLRYGITAEQAEELRRRQGGICVICLRKAAVHVDHDHATGKVRNLLCFSCNGGLGQFEDDAERMRTAARYLEGPFIDIQHFDPDAPSAVVQRSPGKLWDRYGMRESDFQRHVKLQRGRCPICRERPAEHVDHDHRTGVVRGILCPSCNTGMGQLGDDAPVLLRAADYVQGRLVRTVEEAAGERLSFTDPDVDPGTVPIGAWRLHREADAQARRELMRRVKVIVVEGKVSFTYETTWPTAAQIIHSR